MALAGLILGYWSAAVIPIVLIIAAIAIPNLLRSRMVANEAGAVGSVRTIAAAAINYSAQYGHGFPVNLQALGPSANGAANADGADLIDAALAGGTRYGYVFSYEASSSQSGGALDTFRINADPITPDTTGVRHFYADQTGVIRYQEDGPAMNTALPLNETMIEN